MPDPVLTPPEPLDLDACALFLDLDGTLASLEPRPDDVRPDPRRTALLRRLQSALDGRLAIVSGRPLTAIDEILEASVLCASGVHGLERRGADGETVRFAPDPGLMAAATALTAFAATRDGLLLEDKGTSLALHYRLAPEAAEAALDEARRLADLSGLRLQGGDQVVELRTPGPDKGAAVETFMREQPFLGARPIFVGDDLTDEDAFVAVSRLGGLGVLVGPARRTEAQRRLEDVEAVLAWLEAGLPSPVA